MASVGASLRRTLEKIVVEAREVAEAGARAALERIAVHRPQPFGEMSPQDRELRARLRAHAHQLGDARTENGEQAITRLVAECAYEHWHRMLFGRFLAENRLLIHPEHGVPVTLAECEELAAEASEGDGWALAGRFAARMLPAIFRPDDPVLSVRLAPEHQQTLEKLLAELPAGVFTADDSLGWVYQFWQTKRKKEVNESGSKIGADELPAVTQLFTEPYMVQLLLHNTLGAWWAGKVLAARLELAQTAASEEDLRRPCALPGYEWTYLRFARTEEGGPWRPAAGTFEGWPGSAAAITVLDPCCGSGHFLVEAFRILVPMRMAEEGFSTHEACDAVLRDNIFGLEIDERCTQIAAFNLALAAWTYPSAGGYRPLPELQIACSGLAVGAKEEEWLKLAGRDERLSEGMRRLHRLFTDAPTLGSLIDPRGEFEARRAELEFDKGQFDQLRPLLGQALAREEVKRDARATEAGIAAQGMAKAAALLGGSYALVATNVPYLGRGAQTEVLKGFADERHREAKADLATIFLSRIFRWLGAYGTAAVVTPQNWLFLTSYKKLREQLLSLRSWNLVVRLGPGAFETIGGHVVNVALIVASAGTPEGNAQMGGLDVSSAKTPREKAALLRGELPAGVSVVPQEEQLKNPDHRIVVAALSRGRLLREIADGVHGLGTKDSPAFIRCFWESDSPRDDWEFMQSSVESSHPYGGLEHMVFWQGGKGILHERAKTGAAILAGAMAHGRSGVLVSQVGTLTPTLYLGWLFEKSAAVIALREGSHLAPVWEFCQSPQFQQEVRRIDAKLFVTNTTLVKVPIDLEHWQRVAAEKYPQGLPEPQTNDPTQWVFHGHPAGMVAASPASASPFGIADPVGAGRHQSLICRTPNPAAVLQAAMARLLGYCWPAELDPKMRLDVAARAWVERCGELADLADDDGIVCVPPVRGEQLAADRLQRLLARAFGAAWTSATLPTLLDQVGFSGKTLEDWLRDGFFEQHCQLFHQRPFVWQIWDGRRRDGFAALVNYHKLDRKVLERLTYTVLGDWIVVQRKDAQAGVRGAEDRLAVAEALQKKLALILEGEPPYDIFVRWKPLSEQPIGWEPDLNDGVRMNIRPFLEAGVLRKDPKIKWTKDRGAEPESLRPKEQFPWFWTGSQFTGERVNDVHLANAEKITARTAGGFHAKAPVRR